MLESAEIVREVHAALERDLRVDFRRHPIVIEYQPDGSLVLQGETEVPTRSRSARAIRW